jgi:hypothetical protein
MRMPQPQFIARRICIIHPHCESAQRDWKICGGGDGDGGTRCKIHCFWGCDYSRLKCKTTIISILNETNAIQHIYFISFIIIMISLLCYSFYSFIYVWYTKFLFRPTFTEMENFLWKSAFKYLKQIFIGKHFVQTSFHPFLRLLLCNSVLFYFIFRNCIKYSIELEIRRESSCFADCIFTVNKRH